MVSSIQPRKYKEVGGIAYRSAVPLRGIDPCLHGATVPPWHLVLSVRRMLSQGPQCVASHEDARLVTG